MKRILAVLPIALAAASLAAAPAFAKSKKHHRAHAQHYAEPRAYAPQGWNGRTVSDPSFGNRAGIDYAKSTGRCVVDLGYGRYEYCGW